MPATAIQCCVTGLGLIEKSSRENRMRLAANSSRRSGPLIAGTGPFTALGEAPPTGIPHARAC